MVQAVREAARVTPENRLHGPGRAVRERDPGSDPEAVDGFHREDYRGRHRDFGTVGAFDEPVAAVNEPADGDSRTEHGPGPTGTQIRVDGHLVAAER
ncbi:hypothetical protein [Glycomyces sp. YM15]|uniref:hypothetical protein n=1 Tax=Glycomyces sp. YM15 TaxID=2800446 RepID=UPI001964183A|nr:hypothetical protein [Glycomyces sp. YM15]